VTKRVKFAIGIHNHQPIGNFPEVFEHATRAAYRPFLELLARFPEIRMSFHFTGILLRWIEEHHPDLIDLLRTMVQRGQIEILTGGFYEPILPMIPDRDKVGQIQRLTEYTLSLLGARPTGMWLAERVWEPSLAKPIAEAGVRYTLIDDSHFKSVGYVDDELLGYYVTEEQGVPLAIFPISEFMRYAIPFKLVEESIQYFRSVATEAGDRLVVLGDDGEKFGVWPGTHQWVYKEKWLEKFFQALQDNQDWIEVVTFSEYLDKHRSRGPVYLPTASYSEMMQWALPAERSRQLDRLLHEAGSEPCRPFLRGGFWRVFLSKYRESSNMHKKMLHVGELVNRIAENERSDALDALWTGQCNCAYWHGVFGGLYMNHLRKAIYENLIRAECLADEALHRDKHWIEVEKKDFFRDGGQCVLVSTPRANLYFDLDQGGSLFELDHKGKAFNLLNTLTRREEAYHDKLRAAGSVQTDDSAEGSKSIHDIVLMKEEGLADRLWYDWYRRSALIDHFLGDTTTLEEFQRCEYTEVGDFVQGLYEADWQQDGTDRLRLRLWREGNLWLESQAWPVRVEKEVVFHSGETSFPIRYTITNKADKPLSVRFGAEFGFSLQAGDTPDRYYILPGRKQRPRLGSVGASKNIREITLVEQWLGLAVRLEMDQPATFWRFPIETISNSEAGFERVYQSSVVLVVQEKILKPGEPWTFQLALNVAEL